MTDQPDDPRKRYPPPMFAPAAPPGPEGYPPPAFAPAAPPVPMPAAPAAEPAPAVPSVMIGEIRSAPSAIPAPPPAEAAAPPPAEEPLLPATFRENDLRTAIGSPAMPEQIRPPRRRERDDDDGDDDDAPRSRKTMLVVAGSLFLGLGIAALVILGRVNAGRYVVTCDAKEVIAEQGRSFPPWGTSRLGGDEWKPIPIPASFQCAALETEDPIELGDAYRKMLVERAESLLTAKEVTQIEPAAQLLEQALLHARGGGEPHKSARQAIQRMLGDVGYWRASAKLQKAATDLADAAKQFEAAAGQRPRYVSDANAWATYVRKLVDDLRAGPAGARAQVSPQAPPSPDRPTAPAGVALPVEPDAGSGSGAGSAEPPPATPDAGVPSGGVLL
jgi:hypothetical protein